MIVLCGKTCSGKNYFRDLLVAEGIEPVVTYTTRPMRQGEIQDKTYHFLSKEEFQQKQKENFFVESTAYNIANGADWYYGSHFDKSDDDKVIILNPEGVAALRNSKHLAVTPVVFYVDASDEVLRNRAIQRGDKPENVEKRLAIDATDFKDIGRLVDIIIDNSGRYDTKDAVKKILEIHSEKLKEKSVKPWVAPSIEEKEKLNTKEPVSIDR